MDKTYIGIVEDNQDPKKLGRVKARVLSLHEDMTVAELPWAMPWKDLGGDVFKVPDKGKIVIIVFDQNDKNRPEFIYADHYNDNLEKKISSLSDSDYLTMKSLIFDHRTQIYVNNAEGLKIDYKYNNINITESTVDLNLKDNNRSLNLGDAAASQQAILGNHWMDWFDEFVDNLLGSKAGPFLGNLGAPVVPNPAFISCLQKYKALRDPVFLSHHVNIVDNNKVTTVSKTKREDNPQLGDNWKSTKKENDQTTKTDENFKPVEGPKKQFDDSPTQKKEQPPANSTAPGVAGATSSPPGNDPTKNPSSETSGTASSVDNLNKEISPEEVKPPEPIPPTSVKSNPFLDKLTQFMKSKDYIVHEETEVLNIVAMRGKDDGTVTNKFDDVLHVFYRDTSDKWIINDYEITTTPGFVPPNPTASETPKLPQNVPILKLGQYVEQLKFGNYEEDPEHKCLVFDQCVVSINSTVDRYVYSSSENQTKTIYLKRSSKIGSSETVFNFSKDGSQCFKKINHFNDFMSLCETQAKTKERFTYTLLRKSEFEKFVPTE